jgi:hypothetical protein
MEEGAKGEFEITGTPPPDIDEIDPFRSPAADEVTLTITGDYFQNGAMAQVIMPDDTLFDLATSFVNSHELSAVIPGSSLQSGVYPIRVVNPDEQYDIYYSYSATPSSAGHLGNVFELTDENLVTGRWRQGSTGGFDDFSRSYLYTAGGIDAEGNVLDDVEIVPLSLFGDVGAPWVSEQWVDADTPRAANALNTPRQGLALVRAGKWLFAVGGTDVDTSTASPVADAFDTIERAEILGLSTRPEITSAEVTSGGSLEIGTWYYRVSAVGPWGESLASSLKMIPGAQGKVSIEWSAVDGADTYNVYRNIGATGNGGEVHLLAVGIAGTSFDDEGTTAPTEDDVTPLPNGSIGKWKIVEETMIECREGLDSIVATVPSGEDNVEDKTFLFVVGGRPDATGAGYFASGERAEVLDNGELGEFQMLSYDMNTPRAFYVLLTNQGQMDPGFTDADVDSDSDGDSDTDADSDADTDPDIPLPPPASTKRTADEPPLFLIAVLGDDAHEGNANKGLTTFEVSEIVDADGDNNEWATQSYVLGTGQAKHGLGALLYFNYMFYFDGVKSETLGENPSTHGSAAARLDYVEDAEQIDILQSYQSTNTKFVISRAYYTKMVRINGYLFAIGGNDGEGPLDSIERILQ